MTEREFRAKVKAEFPHVTITIRTVSFEGFGFGRCRALRITGDRGRESAIINQWVKTVGGILPDGNARIVEEEVT